MYLESKVERSAAGRHGLDFAFRGEHEYLGGKEVQLDGIEKVHGIGLWVVQNLLDGAQPFIQFVLILGIFTFVFVFPVSRKALFGHLVHAVTAYLNFNPTALFAHQSDV